MPDNSKYGIVLRPDCPECLSEGLASELVLRETTIDPRPLSVSIFHYDCEKCGKRFDIWGD